MYVSPAVDHSVPGVQPERMRTMLRGRIVQDIGIPRGRAGRRHDDTRHAGPQSAWRDVVVVAVRRHGLRLVVTPIGGEVPCEQMGLRRRRRYSERECRITRVDIRPVLTESRCENWLMIL